MVKRLAKIVFHVFEFHIFWPHLHSPDGSLQAPSNEPSPAEESKDLGKQPRDVKVS